MEKIRNSQENLVLKYEVYRQFGRTKREWENNIRIYLTETG